MSEFSIKFSSVENTIEVLSHYAVQLNEIKQEVASVKCNLAGMGSASYRVYSVLSNIDRGVLEEALSMRSMTGALEKISDYYRSTEGTIVSAGRKSMADTETADASSTLDSIVEDAQKAVESMIRTFRDLLVTLGIVKAEKQTRTPGEEVTEAQQREMDRYMQNEIEEILKKDRYSEEVWNAADLEERKDILNEYLQEVAAVMGLQIGPINFELTEGTDDGYLMGSYSDTLNRVTINTWVMQDNVPNSYALLSTIVHEMRHAYQYAACENPDQFVVTEETIESWQNSFDNYKDVEAFMNEGMEWEEAFESYRGQSVEEDARSFAGEN